MIIFLIKDNDFIATQYYREIAKIKNLVIRCVESVEDIYLLSKNNIFEVE